MNILAPLTGREWRLFALALGLLPLVAVTAACAPQSARPNDTGSIVTGIADHVSATPSAPASTSSPSVPTATTAPPPTSSTPDVPSNRSPLLRPGASGEDVLELQRQLTSLGYWLGPPDGNYGLLTEQAVMALQKAAGLSRDGVFGSRTRTALHHRVQPQPQRHDGSGIEVDLRRQLLIYVQDGAPTLIVNASTGSGAHYLQNGADQVAITPTGKFTVYREVDGQDNGPLGSLWRPKYIVGGVAIHGYSSVPIYPASHGCIRVSNAAMDHLWSSALLPIGSSVWVY